MSKLNDELKAALPVEMYSRLMASIKAREDAIRAEYEKEEDVAYDALKASLIGLLRHVLTIAGGAVATRGFIATSEVEIYVGAGLAVVGAAWSVFEKKRKRK